MSLSVKSLIVVASAAILASCTATPTPDTLTGDYLAGRFAARANAVTKAAEAYADAHAGAPQQTVLLKQTFFYHLAAGEIDQAAVYAQRILDIAAETDDGLARVTLAAHAIKQGRLKQARALLNGDMRAPFTKSIAYLMNVWIERGLSGPEAAMAKLQSPGEEIFDGFNPLHVALLAEQAGRMDEARAAYQASVFSLGGPIGRTAYGAFLERSGDEAAARAFYQVLAQDAGAGRRMAEEAMKRLDRGAPSNAYKNVRPAEGAAIAVYSFAGALIEQAAGERARAAEAGFEIGDPHYNLPLALTRLAQYLDPDLLEARRLAGQILNIHGDYDAARIALAEIPPSSPYFEQSRIDMAAGLAASDREDEAAALLKDAIRRDGRSIELKWTLATLYAGEGDHEKAVEALDNVIRNLPDGAEEDAWRYYVSRGASLLEMGRWENAEADLKKAVELAPEEPSALNYLGYSWAERGVNLEKAFELIEKAVALAPDDGAIIDSLGWAHYQLGRYDEAVGHLEQAAALVPSDPTVTDHLGDVYWRLGRETEARFQWRRALELDPNDKQQTAITRKLERGLEPLGGEGPE